MPDLEGLLYGNPHGWARIGKIKKILENKGYVFTPLERHNQTDGEWHQKVSLGDNSFELNANIWRSSTFQPLIDWLKKQGE